MDSCKCLEGFFEDKDSNTCKECVYPCSQCSGSATSCTTCKFEALMDLENNTCKCKTGYYEKEENCLCKDLLLL